MICIGRLLYGASHKVILRSRSLCDYLGEGGGGEGGACISRSYDRTGVACGHYACPRSAFHLMYSYTVWTVYIHIRA